MTSANHALRGADCSEGFPVHADTRVSRAHPTHPVAPTLGILRLPPDTLALSTFCDGMDADRVRICFFVGRDS